MSKQSVLKDWVGELTLSMQGTLLCAMRGPDGREKDDAAKPLVRAFRACITNNARALTKGNDFAGDGTPVPRESEQDVFFRSIDGYNVHWLLHFIHGAQVIAYMHPEAGVRAGWTDFYNRAVHAFHMEPESKETFTRRLRYDGAGVECDLSVVARTIEYPTKRSRATKLEARGQREGASG